MLLAALDMLPPTLDTMLLFPAPAGGPLNLDNFRKTGAPAVEAAGVNRPATRMTCATRLPGAHSPPAKPSSSSPNHGHFGQDDRAPLWRPDRRRARAGITGRLDALEAEIEESAEAEASS